MLLRRGDTWRESLKPLASGTPERPIVFGAYGAGVLPAILGSELREGTGHWRENSPSVWYTTGIPHDPGMVFHDGVGSRRVGSTDQLRESWDWRYEARTGRVYMRLGANPGRHRVEVPQRHGIGFSAADHLLVENVEIAFAWTGIGIWGGRGWTIRSVSIHDVVIDGVQGNRGTREVTVEDSIFQDWGWRSYLLPMSAGETAFGYAIQVISGASPAPPSDAWRIRGNRFRLVSLENRGADATAINVDQGGHAAVIADNAIEGNRRAGGGGIMVWQPRGATSIDISGNSIRDVGSMGINVSDLGRHRFSAPIRIERNRVLNACALDLPDEEAIRVWTGTETPVTVATNLVVGTPSGRHPHPGIRLRRSRQVTVVANTVYGTDAGLEVERGSEVALMRNNISAGNRVSAMAVEAGSRVREDYDLLQGPVLGFTPGPSTRGDDPRFVSPSTGDFHLDPASPAVDRGGEVSGFAVDLDGRRRPAGPGWDIGAYEADR